MKVHTSYGHIEASVMKSHLESEGIPVLLKYDSASQVFGITVDGLGKVHVMVPEEFAEEAKEVLKGREGAVDTPGISEDRP